MAEPNMPNGFDPQARYLQLDERVTNLRSSVSHLEQKVDSGFNSLASQFTSLGAELRGAQTTKWQLIWPAVAVALSFSVVVGSLAYLPIREDNAEAKTSILEITGVLQDLALDMPDKFIPRKETERLSARGAEDRARTDAAIADLRDGTVTRNEWMERNHGRDTELANMGQRLDTAVADLGRRIDAVAQTVGDTYGARDKFQDQQAEINYLRTQITQLVERVAAAMAARP
jgi:hypothetical protein